MKPLEELLHWVRINPDLPVVCMVNEEIIGDEYSIWWKGEMLKVDIERVYEGREHIHFGTDDAEDVLNDLVGCKYGCDPQGRDIYELSDEEWDELYESVPWVKSIVVYIGV